jgi:2-iminobutanoate/2-iminopropanoate deaminase
MRIEKTPLVPDGHSRPVGAYSPGMAVSIPTLSRLVFVTGQVATDYDGNVLCRDDPAEQTRIVFDRIAAVLSEAGGDLSHLLSLTIYVTDLAHFAAVSATRNRILHQSAPASTLVHVAGLVEAGCLVEISGIAAI